MKHTPLFRQHIRAGALCLNLKGVARPLEYVGHAAEHRATRTAVSLCDVSHMGEITVTGSDACRLMQRLVTGNADKLRDGQAMYTALCDEQGRILDDLVLMRRGPGRLLLVVNVTRINADFQWILRHAGDCEAEIRDVSADTALMALQGPAAREALQQILRADLAELPYYGLTETEALTLDGGIVPCLVSRTGYTGELGYEIAAARDDAPFIWEMLLRAGRPLGLVGQGVAARESLRTEAGLLLNGNDMDGDTTPYEAGLDWIVDLSTDFIGRDALVRAKAAGPRKKLVGLALDGRPTMRHGCPVFCRRGRGSERTGMVTSGPLSPALAGQSLGLACVAPDLAAPGQELEVEIMGERHPVRVVPLPFRPRRVRNVPRTRTLSPFSLRFLNENLWIADGADNTLVLGLTAHATAELGEILYYKAPTPGACVAAGRDLAWTDSYRCVFPVALPFPCTVVSVNRECLAAPGLINAYPYHAAGLFTLTTEADTSRAMDIKAWQREVARLRGYASWSRRMRTV